MGSRQKGAGAASINKAIKENFASQLPFSETLEHIRSVVNARCISFLEDLASNLRSEPANKYIDTGTPTVVRDSHSLQWMRWGTSSLSHIADEYNKFRSGHTDIKVGGMDDKELKERLKQYSKHTRSEKYTRRKLPASMSMPGQYYWYLTNRQKKQADREAKKRAEQKQTTKLTRKQLLKNFFGNLAKFAASGGRVVPTGRRVGFRYNPDLPPGVRDEAFNTYYSAEIKKSISPGGLHPYSKRHGEEGNYQSLGHAYKKAFHAQASGGTGLSNRGQSIWDDLKIVHDEENFTYSLVLNDQESARVYKWLVDGTKFMVKRGTIKSRFGVEVRRAFVSKLKSELQAMLFPNV